MKRIVIKNKWRLITFLVGLIYVCLCIFIQPPKEPNLSYKPVKVIYGDTYWQYAREAQREGLQMDVRYIVHLMEEESGIRAGELRAGDTIFIPMVKE